MAALPISTRTVLLPGTDEVRTLLVFCPMRNRAVSLEDGCARCASCAGFEANADASLRPSTLCTYDGRRPPAHALPVGSVLARHAVCIRVDALAAGPASQPQSTPLPIVDEELRLLGLLDPQTRTTLEGVVAVDERTSMSEALRQLARRRSRSATVVAGEGTVVGVVDDLDVLRALRH